MKAIYVVLDCRSIFCMFGCVLLLYEIALRLNHIAMNYWLCLMRLFGNEPKFGLGWTSNENWPNVEDIIALLSTIGLLIYNKHMEND